MQVVQTAYTVKRQEALAREAGVEKAKHHVNAVDMKPNKEVNKAEMKHQELKESVCKIEQETKLAWDTRLSVQLPYSILEGKQEDFL